MAAIIVTIKAEPTDFEAFMEDVELGINRVVGSLGFTADNVSATVQAMDWPGATSYTIQVPKRQQIDEEDWED